MYIVQCLSRHLCLRIIPGFSLFLMTQRKKRGCGYSNAVRTLHCCFTGSARRTVRSVSGRNASSSVGTPLDGDTRTRARERPKCQSIRRHPARRRHTNTGTARTRAVTGTFRVAGRPPVPRRQHNGSVRRQIMAYYGRGKHVMLCFFGGSLIGMRC